MPSNRADLISRVKQVEREYYAMDWAVNLLIDQIRRGEISMEINLKLRDVTAASQRSEATYIIRLFSEFEATLRLYWSSTRQKNPPLRTRDLIDSIGTRNKVANSTLTEAHRIRDFRNSLIHTKKTQQEVLTIQFVRKHLCTFLSFLPVRW